MDNSIPNWSPLVGDISQQNVYHRAKSLRSPPEIEGIWMEGGNRFATRAKFSGHLHSTPLRNEAGDQVTKGWLAAPLPIDLSGGDATDAGCDTNIASVSDSVDRGNCEPSATSDATR